MKHYIKSTVCIVGSGFCGYAAYLKLMNRNINVILVEGGEYKTPPTIVEQPEYLIYENKYHGSLEGKQQENLLLTSHHSRKYTLGGSSMCWAGWIKPLKKVLIKIIIHHSQSDMEDLSLRKYDEESLNLLNSIVEFDPYIIAKI